MHACARSANTRQAVTNNAGRSAPTRRSQAVVIGAGWAGLAAAHALSKAGAQVTVLEAGDSVGGLSGASRSKKGRAIEPGIKGFWHQYNNIEALLAELGLRDVLTDWTESSFYTPRGLEVQAPIFNRLPRLPTPIGNFLYTAPLFKNLSLVDRLSAITLVESLLEHDIDLETYLSYDAMTAEQLFSSVSPSLYRDFLNPILLVTLFLPGDQLSAAAALGCLYYFALANQAAFDVRWCRGAVGEAIIKPWADRLQEKGVKMHTRKRVKSVLPDSSGKPSRIVIEAASDGVEEHWDADVIILSAPIPALQRIAANSPLLARHTEFASLHELTAVDVMAVRLWLDKRVKMPTPSNVAVGFDDGVGATLFDLTVLQDEYRNEPGSVIEVDFYNASPLLELSDEEAVNCALRKYLQGSVPEFAHSTVKDYSVVRGRRAVTAFSKGSAACLPGITTSFDNLFLAGDYIAQGPGTHGAKGLSQEKAYVAGLQAGNLAVSRLGLEIAAEVLPAQADEPHVVLGKGFMKQRKAILSGGFLTA